MSQPTPSRQTPPARGRDRLDASMISEPVPVVLTRLCLPMLVGIFAYMSFNAVDTWFAAQLGVRELAAMSFTFPVAMAINSVAIGIGAGTSSALARAIGEGDKARARRLVTDGLVFSLAVSLVLTVCGLLSLEPLFLVLGAEPDLLPLIADYMVIWYAGCAFLMLSGITGSMIRATGNSKLVGNLMVAMAVLNVILDPLLMFGLVGLPRLELQGAALATVIARFSGAAVAMVYIVRCGLISNPFRHLSRLWDSWRRILHVGVPAMATNVIIPVASGVVITLVAKYGEQAVAGLGVAIRIEAVALICFYALSSIIGPFCGQNLGARQYDRLLRALYSIATFCVLAGLVIAVLLWLFGGAIVGTFTESPEAFAVAAVYLTIVPVSYGLYGLVMSVNASFNGIGKPLPGTLISVMRVLGVYLPLAWVLERWLGINGLFVAAALSNLLVGTWAFLWLRATFKNMAAAPEQAAEKLSAWRLRR